MRAASRIRGMGWSLASARAWTRLGKTRSKTTPARLLGDALFVAAAFVQGGFQEGGSRSGATQEGRATKEQVEGAEAVLVVGCQQGLEVGFVEGGGAGAGLLVVETPNRAVGEDAPAEFAIGDGIGASRGSEGSGRGVRRPGFPCPVPRVSRGRRKRLSSARARASR